MTKVIDIEDHLSGKTRRCPNCGEWSARVMGYAGEPRCRALANAAREGTVDKEQIIEVLNNHLAGREYYDEIRRLLWKDLDLGL